MEEGGWDYDVNALGKGAKAKVKGRRCWTRIRNDNARKARVREKVEISWEDKSQEIAKESLGKSKGVRWKLERLETEDLEDCIRADK